MNRILSISTTVAAMAILFSCNQEEKWPAQPDWSEFTDPNVVVDDGLKKPEACKWNIVAHRGGSSECGKPDNSIASLEYAMSLGCYASECDIYWTKDNDVIVCHANNATKINGLYPWEATVAEIRAAGKLSNGEDVPTLEDFIKKVMSDGSCTKLWLDIKNVTAPSTLTEYPIAATKRACEIVTEMGAKHFVEFICTGNTTVMKSAYAYAKAADIPIGWMADKSAAVYAGTYGYEWANLNAANAMCADAGGKGERTIEEFVKEGVKLSVFNVDKQSGDANAVYTEKAWDYYCKNYNKFKALCTNYPSWLMERVIEENTVYDGISSAEELAAFSKTVASDPTAKKFQNSEGEVVLKNDITVSSWTPISEFSGTLDGNGKTITINCTSDAESVGLFSKLSGTVKNLTIAGSITATAAKASVGAIAGTLAEKATIFGCTNNANIIVNNIGEGQYTVGGIYGTGALNNRITNNKNNGDISVTVAKPSASCVVAGVAGFAYSDVSKCTNTGKITYTDNESNAKAFYIGGVIGRLVVATKLTIEECTNEGPVTAKSYQVANSYAGGVVGYGNSESVDNANTFKTLINKGEVLSDAPVSTTANTGKTRMGGISGGSGLMEGCINYGTVQANNGGTGASEFAIGGLTGMAAHNAKDCHNFGNVVNNTTVKNILAHTGGLFGWVTLSLTIEDCSVDADITSTTLYNYDADKNTSADLTHENSSCAGILIGRLKSSCVATIKSATIFGTMTRTINANEEKKVIDFRATVPADTYLYGAVQNAAAGLSYESGAIKCGPTKK